MMSCNWFQSIEKKKRFKKIGKKIIGKKIIGNVTAKNYLKESLWSILRFIIHGKCSSWDQFDPEIYFVAILRMAVNSLCCVICELN